MTTSILPSNQEAAQLNYEFVEMVLPHIRNVVSHHWSAVMVYTIAPQQPDVFAAHAFTPGSTLGLRTGEAMPMFAAWGMEVQRQRRDIRNGYKRFGPIAETDQNGGVATAGALTNLNLLRNAMNLPLELTYQEGGSTASMVIVKRVKYIPDPERPTRYAYRIPIGGDPLVYYTANQWVYDRLTTQNTRKIGRGA